MQKLLSIIMPVYNAEKFLDTSINSVLTQNYDNFELILINDGSKDNSLEICKAYEKKDSRIKVISQENQGIAKARNAGIRLSKGEYITFIDNDDWIAPDLYTFLINNIEKYSVPMAGCSFKIVFDDHEENCVDFDKEGCYSYSDALELLIYIEKDIFNWSVWNKVYKKELVKNIEFTWGLGEDMRFNLSALNRCDKVFLSSAPKYYWNRKNYISESRKGFSEKHCSYIDCFELIEKAAKDKGLDKIAELSFIEVAKRLLSYSVKVKRNKINNYKSYFDKYKKIARSNYKRIINSHDIGIPFKINFMMFCLFPNFTTLINSLIIK